MITKRREQQRRYEKKRHDARRAKGICIKCGQNPIATERSKNCCAQCLDKSNHRHRDCYQPHKTTETPEHLAKRTAQIAAWRKGLRAAGLCVRCGKRPPRPGKPSCQECHEKRRASGRIHYAALKELHAQRQAKGICKYCGKNPIDTSRSKICCTQCLDEENRKNMAKRLNGPEALAIKRDNNTCQLCGKHTSLIAHHIDGHGRASSTPNHDSDNLITLCKNCHSCITYLRRHACDSHFAAKLLVAGL